MTRLICALGQASIASKSDGANLIDLIKIISIESFFIILTVSLFMSAVFVGLFIWGASSGQWDDSKTPAHRLLWESEDESIQ